MGGILILLLTVVPGAWLVLRGIRERGAVRTSQHEASSSVHLTDQRALVEAIASFTEQLRDTVSASAGLEQAISVTLGTCPREVEPAVRRLVADMKYGNIEDALRRFADELSHPTSDFVVAALLAAVQHRTKDLSGLLTQLSESAREECNLYLRVWVSRARTRSAVRIVIGSLAAFTCGLVVLDPGYLAPYAQPSGVVALIVTGAGFGLGLALLDRMARFEPPSRLIAKRAS